MHKPLEDYLAEVARQIVSIPEPRRDEEIKEMRSHLLAAIAANQERGQAEDAAVARALEAFGTPEEASASILIAWRDFARKQIRKGFWMVGGIWSVFFGFMAIASNASDRSNWLLGLAFTWIVCFIGMVVSPLWTLRSRPVRSSVR